MKARVIAGPLNGILVKVIKRRPRKDGFVYKCRLLESRGVWQVGDIIDCERYELEFINQVEDN